MSTKKTPEEIAEERYSKALKLVFEASLHSSPSDIKRCVAEAHALLSDEPLHTPPVTVDGIMEVVKAWADEFGIWATGKEGKALRSRLESYLTPNTKP